MRAPDHPLMRTWTPELPTDLLATLGVLARGRLDHTMVIGRTAADGVWRTSRTPLGAATLFVRGVAGRLVAHAWGPGASWVLDRAPVLVGGLDDLEDFDPGTGVVREWHRRFPALRLCATQRVFQSLFPIVLEQKVTGKEAVLSYGRLQRHFGEPAPGPRADLLLPPDPVPVAQAPSHVFMAANVERMRSSRLKIAATYAHRLEECVAMPIPDARRRLGAIPGFGVWTVNEIVAVALGDADAVSVGDYHLKNSVSFALAGEPRGTDERMLELLEPFRPHRQRVIRLIGAAGVRAPRFGPRLTIQKKW